MIILAAHSHGKKQKKEASTGMNCLEIYGDSTSKANARLAAACLMVGLSNCWSPEIAGIYVNLMRIGYD